MVDVVAIAGALSLLGLARALRPLVAPAAPRIATATLWLCGLGVFGSVVATTLALARLVSVDQETVVGVIASVPVGVWLVFASQLLARRGLTGVALAGYGTAIGLIWMIALPLFVIGGFPTEAAFRDGATIHPLTALGAVTYAGTVFIQPVWALLLERRLSGEPRPRQ